MAKFLLKIASITFLIACANSINIEDAKEGPCIVPPVDQNFDLLWLANYAEWYFPAWSKYELYQWASSISGYSFQNVTEDMAERSCMIIRIGGDAGATQTAFIDKSTTFDSSIADHGTFDWTETRSDGTPGFKGRTYITLTDNDKFYVSVSCWEKDNQKSYSVHSNVKSLDQETKNNIRSHLVALGFDVNKNWVDMYYDDCIDLKNPGKRRQSQSSSSNFQNANTYVPPSQNNDNFNNNNSGPKRNPTSIELFFNIFRSTIDFLQQFFQNASRTAVRLVTRILGRLGLGSLL